MSNDRPGLPSDTLRRAIDDGVLDRARAEFNALERALGELEQSPREHAADAGDYLGYERQFRELERRREAFAALLSEAENARRDAAWARLVSELELAWRDLLPRLDAARTRRR
ncbi:MAG: hypothetical protein RLW61_16110 [Gammaproteobacteria bacterium]|uniref:hypothetical protein n=1 Tax=Oceanibaculum nanhaiense TaxID=1909734 RepID=UPI0032EE7657